jgi:hypothetical protein
MGRGAGIMALLVALGALGACYRGGAELTPSGEGLPQVSADFPAEAAPGSVHSAPVRVANPGPGDIERLAVAFARVGAPAAEGLPHPLVDPGTSPESGIVVGVEPRPQSVSADRVVYRFGPLAEGDSVLIRFRLRVPRRPGIAATSVTAYDDVDPARARGVRLETTVRG